MLTEEGAELFQLDPVVASWGPDPFKASGPDPVQDRGRGDGAHLSRLSGGKPCSTLVFHTNHPSGFMDSRRPLDSFFEKLHTKTPIVNHVEQEKQ